MYIKEVYMKAFVRRFMVVAIGGGFLLSVGGASATTYLKVIVNGDTSATTFVQGGSLGWMCDCGVGDSVRFEYHLDLNVNHVIDAGDKFMCDWYITDGDTSNEWGPGDSDPTPDGIILAPGNINGSAPEHYCFRAIDESASSAEDFLEFLPISPPAATVSGTVSIEGITAPDPLLLYITVGGFDMETRSSWAGLTDLSGDYTTNFAVTGVEWHLGTWFEIPGYENPSGTTLVVTGNITGIDFLYTEAGIEESSAKRNTAMPLILTPNPVLGNVMIQYTLPAEARVSLKLYDLTGTVIETIASGKRSPGHHHARLATDHLSSGIYFVTLETDGPHACGQTEKLILAR
jgi:hypothetical protein